MEELSDISNSMDSINARYPNITKKLDIAVDHSEYNFKSSSFSNATDSRFKNKVDLISIAQKDYIESQPHPGLLWTFKDNFVHEIGHLVTTEYIKLINYGASEAKKDSLFLSSIRHLPEDKRKESIRNMRASERLRESFVEINSRSLIDYVGPAERIRKNFDMIREALIKGSQIPNSQTNEEVNRPIGFVSSYAGFYQSLSNWDKPILTLSFQLSELHGEPESFKNTGTLEEDIAETFAYMVNNHHYADSDSLVQEKIKAIDEFISLPAERKLPYFSSE